MWIDKNGLNNNRFFEKKEKPSETLTDFYCFVAKTYFGRKPVFHWVFDLMIGNTKSWKSFLK